MGRDVYIAGRPIELIPANWDKTMICGSMDSPIWQNDQQVRPNGEMLLRRSEIFIFATIALSRGINETKARRVFTSAEKIFGVSVDAHTDSRGWKYDVNATNRCEDVGEYFLFSGCTPTELARLYYICRDGISFDASRNDLGSRVARQVCARVSHRLN